MSHADLTRTNDTPWDNREGLGFSTKGDVRDAVETALSLLDKGEARVAEKIDGTWVVNQWLKKAVLLSFRLTDNMIIANGPGAAEYDWAAPGQEEAYKARLDGVSAGMFGAMGIARDDGAGRMAAMAKNTTSFDAPAVLFVYFPRLMKEPQWSDVGMWLQTVALLLREEGLDSCFQEYMAIFANTIRDFLGLDHERYMFFCGMAIGYRDPDAPVNNFERQRVPLGEQVKFIGFE